MTSHPVGSVPVPRCDHPTPADPIATAGVVIPARNEQARPGRCLDAVAAAIANLRGTEFASVAVQTVVVLDRCTDRTADGASQYSEVHTVGNVGKVGNVGIARALGVRSVLPAAAELRRDVRAHRRRLDGPGPGPGPLAHAHA
jgi:hypothetical protein